MAIGVGTIVRQIEGSPLDWAPQKGDLFKVISNDGFDYTLRCLNPNWLGIHENGRWYSELGNDWQVVDYTNFQNGIKCPNCNCNLNVSLAVVS